MVKKVVLKLKDVMDILERIEMYGSSLETIAEEYDLSESDVKKIRENLKNSENWRIC